MVLRSNPLNVAFRRSLAGNNLQALHHLVTKVVNVQLIDQRDHFIWSIKQNGQLTVRSRKNVIWKLKLPLKDKIFGPVIAYNWTRPRAYNKVSYPLN
jgi:hypothetical protein